MAVVADQIMRRILFLPPMQEMTMDASSSNIADNTRTDDYQQGAENALKFSLVFSGVRCLLQYALLPFVLPVIGVATDATIPLMLAINVIAMISIVFSLRRFWAIGYQHRWQYLGVAIFAFILLTAFMVMDIGMLQQA